jgi:hypothetical protein
MEKIIDKIPEIKNARYNYHVLKRNLNKERRKIKSLYKKYYFINMITSKDVDDHELEGYILQLFQDLAYKTKKPNKRDLDVIVSLNSSIIGIEVKNGNLPSENDMFQARKYAIRHLKNTNKIMHPLTVWNNAKTGQKFDSFRIIDAEENLYGIITTSELLKGYLKVKQKTLNLKTFDYLINKTGLIKFSNSILKKLDSSVNGYSITS